jgi:nicotinamide-nucleotide amidase
MKAAIIAVGSEMLGSERLDTNSLRLSTLLARYGVELRRKSVVGDLEADLVAEIHALLPVFDLVIVSGGLGPTADDVTRPAVAAALDRGISIDEGVVEVIAERFARMGRKMAEVNRRQAEVIDGATVLANDRGSAPGLTLTEGRSTLFLFPGVPSELDAMCARYLEPWLAERTGGAALESAVLKVACVAESTLEEWIAPSYDEFGREAITVLAKPGEIEVWATAAGEPAARQERLAVMKARLRELIGDSCYAEGPRASLEGTLGELLRRAGATLATAESCTGGLVAERLTRVPGSSDYFVGGAVTYSDRLKSELLGVPEALLAEHGAVSEPVVRAMAEGARTRLGADYAIAITGVAGPGGGSPEKPVGTVEIAIAGPGDGEVEAMRIRYPGDRERIRWISSQFALEMLRRRLAGLGRLSL